MSDFSEIFLKLHGSDDFEENTQVAHYLANVIKQAKKPFSAAELEAVRTFSVGEMQRLLKAIPNAKSYREKDIMFAYEDALFMLFSLASENMKNVTEEQLDTIRKIAATVHGERVLENALDDMFQLETIELSDVLKLLEIVKPIKDRYRRGMLYQGLHAYKDDVAKFTDEAKSAISEFTAAEMEELLACAQSLDEDELDNLEFSVDVCKYFITERLLNLLEKVMTLPVNRVRFYALETLLGNERTVPEATVAEMARDLTYAELTYSLLKRYKKSSLFPKELENPEYLAKSDMVHWLTYPTELNREPDEIELMGAVKKKKELYYVFKFNTHSEKLPEELHGKWLIGWANENGNTFSNFDLLSDFEKKTPKKTLKNIAKKLL